MLLVRIILSKDEVARYATATIKNMLQLFLCEIAFDLVKVITESISLDIQVYCNTSTHGVHSTIFHITSLSLPWSNNEDLIYTNYTL